MRLLEHLPTRIPIDDIRVGDMLIPNLRPLGLVRFPVRLHQPMKLVHVLAGRDVDPLHVVR